MSVLIWFRMLLFTEREPSLKVLSKGAHRGRQVFLIVKCIRCRAKLHLDRMCFQFWKLGNNEQRMRF